MRLALCAGARWLVCCWWWCWVLLVVVLGAGRLSVVDADVDVDTVPIMVYSAIYPYTIGSYGMVGGITPTNTSTNPPAPPRPTRPRPPRPRPTSTTQQQPPLDSPAVFLPHPRHRSVGSYFDTSHPESARFENCAQGAPKSAFSLGGYKYSS